MEEDSKNRLGRGEGWLIVVVVVVGAAARRASQGLGQSLAD